MSRESNDVYISGQHGTIQSAWFLNRKSPSVGQVNTRGGACAVDSVVWTVVLPHKELDN